MPKTLCDIFLIYDHNILWEKKLDNKLQENKFDKKMCDKEWDVLRAAICDLAMFVNIDCTTQHLFEQMRPIRYEEVCTCICTVQAVPVYSLSPRLSKSVSMSRKLLWEVMLILATSCYYKYNTGLPQHNTKYRILEIVGIPTIFRYTDSGGSPVG